jgi:hypothetical protein
MKLFGIPLRKPNSGELTAAAVMATGLWVAAIGLLRVLNMDIDRADAGALLVVMWWGCVSVRCGIRVGMGNRHLAANLAVSAVLLALYQGAWAMAG